MPPKDAQVLIPRTYVTLHDKKDFTDVTKPRTLSWRDAIIRVFVMERVREEEQTGRCDGGSRGWTDAF